MMHNTAFQGESSSLHIYEQPLAERMRLFMRLESMFEQLHLFHQANEYYSIRLFLDALFDILDFLHRYEIRAEVFKELQRISLALEREYLGADKTFLEEKVSAALAKIHQLDFNPINRLRENELLNSLRQRNVNKSGNCLFEVPAYQFWLANNIGHENEFLNYCYQLFIPLSEAIAVSLSIIRSSATLTEEYTDNGIFLKTLDKDRKNQILRIHLPTSHCVFPRISGDNHRFAIRFMEQNNPQTRSVQTKEPVVFSLQICAM